MEVGTRVTLIEAAIDPHHRPHLRKHARDGDIGKVTTPVHGGVPGEYVLVQFENCPHAHRVLPEELEPVL